MATEHEKDAIFLERLSHHSALRTRFERLVGVIEDAAGGIKKVHWHTTFGEIHVIGPLWREGTGIRRLYPVAS